MKKHGKLLAGLVAALFMTGIASMAMAEGKNGYNMKEGEMVFLLDASGSMKTQDRSRLAIDAIRQTAYSLPSNYKAGMVAYNTGIQAISPMEAGMEQMEIQLAASTYQGYTNAGEGLRQAMGLFTDRAGVDRTIILITDGEIDMPDIEAKESSRSLYRDAVRKAKEEGVKIYIIAVGSGLTDPRMHIFDGAEMTDGAIYWAGQSGSVAQIMERILYDRMKLPRQPVGVTDGNGGSLLVRIPSPGAERIKIVLTSGQGIGNVTADYSAETGRIISGQNFSVVDMIRPASETVKVQFQTSDLAEVEAYMMLEYSAEVSVDTFYRHEAETIPEGSGNKKAIPAYTHYADLKIRLKDRNGRNDNLLNSPGYEGKEVPFLVNGVWETGKISGGIIPYSMAIDGLEELTVEVDLSGFPERYGSVERVSLKLDPPPDPIPAEPDYRPLWGILGVLAIVLAFILGAWIRKKNATVFYVAQPPSAEKQTRKMETKSCTYTGKLNLYVVRTGDGRDVAPQTYRLFGHSSERMTLERILTSCKIRFEKMGAEDIIFYPGQDRSLIVMDQSEHCTALRGTEILKKGMGYPVFYGDKITIIFEDEATEMEIHYRNLKPSEMEG